MHEEQRRVMSRKLFYVALAGSGFSLYNLSRFTRLSPSGKPAAAISSACFLFLTMSSYRLGKSSKGMEATELEEPRLEGKDNSGWMIEPLTLFKMHILIYN